MRDAQGAGGGAATDNPEAPIAALMAQFPRAGRIVWIGLRTARHGAITAVTQAQALAGAGLAGDHYAERAGAGGGRRKRQVTLIQAEHLVAVGALLGEPPIDPVRVRRNLVVAGINLLALKDRRFRIGDAVLETTGLAHPCSRMEAALGSGGYNAMRGHGGITAAVVSSGVIAVGDTVEPVPGGD
jgi:MOSC domain-containing protein YiiM